MKTLNWRSSSLLWLAVVTASLLPTSLSAEKNQVLGELQLEGKTKVEKTSGVWIDGQYVGYLKELKGSKKVLLLPGGHDITVRQDGYTDFRSEVTIQPGETQVVDVAMEKAVTGPLSQVTATVKIAINPSRAAVFLDGLYVGHVGEFEGAGRGMLVAPGDHQIVVSLPGYQTFDTHITASANQKIELKTDLLKSDAPATAAAN